MILLQLNVIFTIQPVFLREDTRPIVREHLRPQRPIIKTVRKSPEDKLREILQRRQSPLVITSRKSMPEPSDIREIRARETLKRVLGDDKFKSFLKKGFISVRATNQGWFTRYSQPMASQPSIETER